MIRRRRAARLLVLLLALAVRLAWGVSRPVDQTSLEALPDQCEYLQLGRNLLDRHSLEFVDPRFNQTVYAFRMPGYPLLVAACGGNARVIRAVQAVLDTTTAGAAGLLAVSVFDSEVAGLAAASIVAINPFLIYFSGLVLSDTLYTAVFTWALLLLQRRQLVVGSIVLSLGVLIRPSGIAPAIVLPGAAALMLDRSVRSAIQSTLIAGLVLGLTLLPWSLRNHHLLHSWVVTTTNTGFTLYDGYHDGATGASDQRFVKSMPELQAADEVGRSAMLQRRASDWIRLHPWSTIRLAVAKLVRLWSPIPLSAEFNRPGYTVVGAVWATVDVCAMLVIWKRRRRLHSMAVLLSACVVISAIHAASVGSLRYRMPVEPVVAVIAAGLVVRVRADVPATC